LDIHIRVQNYDVNHRWNSTWKMFACGLSQRQTLQHFHNRLLTKGKADWAFTDDDWEVIEKLCKLLEVFKTSTECLSGVYYTTSPLVLQQLWLMCENLKEFGYQGHIFESMTIPMKDKFKKYFADLPPVICCAAALNPLINVTGVETLIENICDDLDMYEQDVMYSRNAKRDFNTQFQNLFDHYLTKYGNRSNVETMVSSSSSAGGSSFTGLYNIIRNENTKRARGSTPSSELGRYTGTDFLSTVKPEDLDKFDILGWWRVRENQYPILAAMARDLLTVQASTVASESAFSLGGRVLSVRRTRLTPESMEMCICLKDHLDAAERVQDKSRLEMELDVEQELHEIEVYEGDALPLSDEDINQISSGSGSDAHE
jgi:hypothetical protein